MASMDVEEDVRTYVHLGEWASCSKENMTCGCCKICIHRFSFINIFGFWFHWKPIFSHFPENKTTTEKSWSSRNKQTYTHKKTYLKHILNCYKKDVTKTQYTFRRRKLKNTPDDESDITFFLRIMSHMNTSYFGDINEQGVHILPPPPLSMYVCRICL